MAPFSTRRGRIYDGGGGGSDDNDFLSVQLIKFGSYLTNNKMHQ